MKKYTVSVPCSMTYEVKASSKKEACELVFENGGLDLEGEVCIIPEDFHDAHVVDEEDL